MGLYKKTLLTVGSISLILMMLLILISYRMVLGSFAELESKYVRINAKRILSEFSDILSGIDTTLGDWAHWDDTYEFVQNGNESYINANLLDSTLNNLKIDFMIFLNTEGNVVFFKCLNLKGDKETVIFDELLKQILDTPALVKPSPEKKSESGILMFSEKPTFIASQPILKNDWSGPSMGVLIIGRYFETEELQELSSSTHMQISLQPYNDPNMPTDFFKAKSEFSDAENISIQPLDNDSIYGYSLETDIKGSPAFITRIKTSRDIFRHGRRTVITYIAFVLVVCLSFILLIMFFLKKVILAPISDLIYRIEEIGQKENFSAVLPVIRSDELGTLALTMNSMLAQLEDARQKLSERSYRSGMAEMASGVLHNVRNALTPIMGNIELLRKDLKGIALEKTERVYQELEQEGISGERREDLTRLLMLTNRDMRQLFRQTDEKLSKILEFVSQIENIMENHHMWAYHERPLESIALKTLIRDSMRMVTPDLMSGITLHFDQVPENCMVLGHHVALIQIFINLLTNAAEAIRQTKREGNIQIRAYPENQDYTEMIHIEVCDDGEGIVPEQLHRIFERDYSTRSRSSGVGLHWCANTIASMNGSIYVESSGPNLGTCFHLLLPKPINL